MNVLRKNDTVMINETRKKEQENYALNLAADTKKFQRKNCISTKFLNINVK